MTLTNEILNNHINEVRSLLAAGADVNALDIYGFTPLIEAAIANNTEIAALLIKQGADVRKKDLTGGTALHWAVENNNLPLCRLLLDNKADPNAYNKSAQPVLLQALLRNQQDLKELLYRYGADLKFAQDYINAKLIGHRFELSGRVDIVDNKNTFIELDFEGFVLEFTISVIQDSLLQFKNNFSARNLRSHFAELQNMIEAFAIAGELIKYQQHLVNIAQLGHRIETISERQLLLLPVGYEGHAITFIKCGHFFAKCDRGAYSLHHPAVAIYQIGNPYAFNAEFVKHLLYKKQNRRFVSEGIFKVLGLELVTTLPLRSQLSGNCSWANVEAAVPTMLLMQWLQMGIPRAVDLQHYQEATLAIYKQWLEWDKDWALHQCVESFYDASPARKASKVAILAAVLFQTCRYTQTKDIDRANKILAVLATKDYRYVLDSYLAVYKDTAAGRNLLELVDLYSK
ncbi:MAG TPA: Dot/Icm T4SS effector AnkH/LegA3 [Gammaproteobacteria bacterium]|nr:Dot/Icm T4SS effector AnkH/LegA3 [Gammaproteobacteria bacterium]